jgi:hydrogenase maturation protease
MKNQTLIVGLGSSHGDDQFGWRVAEELAANLDARAVTVRQASSAAEILGWLDGVEQLVICDACQGLGHPGRLHHWRWPNDALPELRFGGSHDLGVTAALSLAGRLGLLPADVTIWCAEGASFDYGRPICPPVEAAVAQLVQSLQDELMRTQA